MTNPSDNPESLKVLLVEDNPDDAKMVLRELKLSGFDVIVQRVDTEAAFLESLHGGHDFILCDYGLPEFNGLRALELLKKSGLEIPFILVSGSIGEDIAVEAMKQGAADYLLKDRLARLGPAVHHALEQARLSKERQQAQETLRASEEKFRQLTESINEVSWITSADLSTVVHISPSYEKVWGRTCQSLYEKPLSFTEGIHGDDRPDMIAALEGLMRGEKFEREFRVVHPDGKVRWIHSRGAAVRNESGVIYRLAGIAEDVTQRINHERLALRSQRLEAIGTLASGVAHDLNNALAPIMMGVELLQADYPQESDILEMFRNSARRATEMVRQLMSFAKGAEGDRVLVQPSRLVREMESMMKGCFPKNIQLSVKCNSKLPAILGDPTQLHQVLLNLCVNARDAMLSGGTLTLETLCVEIDTMYASSLHDAKPGKYVALRVRDTGTGIPPEIIDRIFDPFFSTKDPDKGTGLGLSTVAGIIKGHGGFMQVYSQPRKGSTFTAYLPVDRANSETEHITTAETQFRGHGETILLVDDEASIREMGRAVLQRLNFKSLTAIDGADALIQAAQHRSELWAIITDLRMPNMDGLTFIRMIRRMLPDIPIVMTSGRLEDSEAKELKILGVARQLDKPFTELQLGGMLKTIPSA
jgi:two-component system cell cycle sensor histidine kinase/response regulator CckA